MITLRPFNSSDGATWHKWYHNKKLSRFFRGFITGMSIEQARSAPSFMQAHILMAFNEVNDCVGAMTFADSDRVVRSYRAGLLVDPEFQKIGIGKQISEQGIEWAFETMNAHKIWAEILEDDSRLLHGSGFAGFQVEGTKRESIYFEGVFKNETLISLLHSEYLELKYGSTSSEGSDTAAGSTESAVQ